MVALADPPKFADQPKCACGLPLHYSDPAVQADVQKICEELGDYTTVSVGGKSYLVQRHYIALHGLIAFNLENLADQGIVKRLTPTPE